MDSSPPDRITTSAPFIPSDWDHAKTLMALSFRKDLKKPKLSALRILLMPSLLMLYTIGFFIGYQGDDGRSSVEGDYRLFKGEDWTYPEKISIGASNSSLLDQVVNSLSDKPIEIQRLNATISNEVIEKCQGNIDDSASNEICAFLFSQNGYNIYYGGKETAYPTQKAIAGTQFAINSALLDVSNLNEAYPASQIQQTPQLLTEATVQPAIPVVLVPAIMFVLAAVISSLFTAGIITNEKINGISKSYLLVGVKMRTYLLQWLAYFSLNGIILAGLLTLVCVFFKLMPMSSGGLIYISNYLGLVQLYAMLVMSMQFVNEEEMASAILWLIGFFCMGVGSAILVLESANHVALTVLTVFFPFIGMMQYFGIYITYDYTGFNTGIHPGMNVASSGLLSNMIAQICGILFWVVLMLLYSSSRIQHAFLRMFGPKIEQITPLFESDESDKFEPLSPDKEVVISIRGLHHTYHPSRVSCNKKQKPVNVLKGLNMDVCRGEILGFLGHNGAGKSTTIEILSTELAIQHGNIVYHFQEGDTHIKGKDEAIKTRIGVCPQHNDSLQDDLTCRETLMLFARLKGGYSVIEGQTLDEAVAGEVEMRLADVKFTSDEDVDKPVGQFSGGMKRKVLIAIALLGDPEVVYLDEPTAGLDPFNRRVIWDMIIQAKQGRSIILTTHFLDEADVLSDRIGIIKNGRLVTCGSSLFLKHTLGAGYTLSYSAELFDVSSFVQTAELISGADVVSKENHQQQWNLNFGSEKQIPDLLIALKNHGAQDIQLDLTTLEDVFLETGKEDFDETDNDDTEEEDSEHDDTVDDAEIGQNKEEHQARIWKQHSTITPINRFRKLRLVGSAATVRTNTMVMMTRPRMTRPRMTRPRPSQLKSYPREK